MVYVLCIHVHRMIPVEIALRMGGMGSEGNLIKIYWKHICKCHNVSPSYNYYMLYILKKKKVPQVTLKKRKGNLGPLPSLPYPIHPFSRLYHQISLSHSSHLKI
jgi:hypothetical protein